MSTPNSNSMSSSNENTVEFNRYEVAVNWDELNAKLALDEITSNFDEAFSTLIVLDSSCSS